MDDGTTHDDGTHGADDRLVVDLRGVSVGERLRLRRRLLRLSQWEAARALGVQQSAVSRAERGQSKAGPLEAALRALAETESTTR